MRLELPYDIIKPLPTLNISNLEQVQIMNLVQDFLSGNYVITPDNKLLLYTAAQAIAAFIPKMTELSQQEIQLDYQTETELTAYYNDVAEHIAKGEKIYE